MGNHMFDRLPGHLVIQVESLLNQARLLLSMHFCVACCCAGAGRPACVCHAACGGAALCTHAALQAGLQDNKKAGLQAERETRMQAGRTEGQKTVVLRGLVRSPLHACSSPGGAVGNNRTQAGEQIPGHTHHRMQNAKSV